AVVLLANTINVFVFIIKCWTLVFVMMWVRWTLPRLRIDQVMMMCLKYLVPMSCVLLAGVSLWMLIVPTMLQWIVQYAIFATCVLATIAGCKMLYSYATLPPGSGMPGMWRTAGSVGYQGARPQP